MAKKKYPKRKVKMLKNKFSIKFYSENAINESIKAYSSLGKIKLEKQKEYFIVYFDKIDFNVSNITVDEFSNYVLAQMVKDKE